MKSTMLATLGHDLKTPVAVARAAVENWEAAAGATEASRLAGTSLAKLTRLVDELLTVIRLESGVASPRRELAACAEIVEAAVARVSERANGRKLAVAPVPAELRVRVDPAQVAEALGLGLENALTHTPPGSAVRIAVEEHDESESIILSVEDDGPGIPVGDRERVTQKFVRLPRSEEKPGSGLGLYIARTLSEMNAGRLTIGSASAGGTRFAISLPKEPA
jgi:signal transduction histidine kinase